MDRISDGIEWRSEPQELFLWLFQQAGARGGPGLHGPPARRRGRLREPWSLDADGELAAYQHLCTEFRPGESVAHSRTSLVGEGKSGLPSAGPVPPASEGGDGVENNDILCVRP